MALGQIPPWLDVSPHQFVAAGQAGAEAGLGAARLRQSAQSESDRLALEADALNQRAQAEASRISQQERIANMEMQARKEIAEQNRMREDQQHLIQNAYHTAMLGLDKDKLAQQQALADEKAREAALTYAHEAAVSKYYAEHPEDPNATATALALNPRGIRMAKILKPAQEATGPTEVEPIEGGSVISRPGSSHWQFIPAKTGPEKLTPAEASEVSLIKSKMKRLDSSIGKASDAVDKLSAEEVATEAGKKKLDALGAKKREYNDAKASLDMIYHKPRTVPTMGSKQMADEESMQAVRTAPVSRVDRANQLAREHPDWSKQQIIDAVKAEFSK